MTGAMLVTGVRVTGSLRSSRSHTGGRHRKPPAARKSSAVHHFSAGVVLRVVAVAVLLVALASIGLLSGRTADEPVVDASRPPAPPQKALNAPGVQPPQASRPHFASDDRGFIASSARCGGTRQASAIGRTAGSLVVICAEPTGQYEYLGVRLSDNAMLRTSAETDSARGFLAQRLGVVYAVSPAELKVTAGATVIKREPMIEYRLLSR